MIISFGTILSSLQSDRLTRKLGPYIMGYVLAGNRGWNAGYRYIAILQIVLTAILIFSLPLWKGRKKVSIEGNVIEDKTLSLAEIIRIPGGEAISLAGFILIGLGCAPVYPCIIHSTPAHFGADRSQAIIGVQMASAYVGTLLMPPVFGLIANHITAALLPLYLAVILVLMVWMHELLTKKTK